MSEKRPARNDRSSLAAYCFAHFAVDFCCFFALFSAGQPRVASVLLYDAVAFGTQFLLGWLCDKRPAFPAGAVGAALTLLGFLLRGTGTAGLMLCALGNALFHVGGGADSLRASNGRLSRGGAFVSTGALGVGLGTLAANSGIEPALPIALIAAALAAVWLFAERIPADKADCGGIDIASRLPGAAVAALAFAAVAVRAFGGAAAPAQWKTTALLALLPSFAAFAGKLAGGFLADMLGARIVGVGALLLSLPLLLTGGNCAALSLAGLFLFNLTMPVSLGTLASVFPDSPGFAFGLSALALLAGTLPLFFVSTGANGAVLLAALTLLSALCTLLSVRKGKRRANSETAA